MQAARNELAANMKKRRMSGIAGVQFRGSPAGGYHNSYFP